LTDRNLLQSQSSTETVDKSAVGRSEDLRAAQVQAA